MKLHSNYLIFCKAIFLFAIGLTTISFAEIFGGDTYHIYLNKKLILNYASSEKKLMLDNIKPSDKLEIVYSHCGVVGQNRRVAIRDQKNNIVKEWKFSDGSLKAPMLIPTQDLLQIKKKHTGTLKLYYAAKQMPDAQMLVTIDPGKADVATFSIPLNASNAVKK
jgi:hypothetical protein